MIQCDKNLKHFEEIHLLLIALGLTTSSEARAVVDKTSYLALIFAGEAFWPKAFKSGPERAGNQPLVERQLRRSPAAT